MLPLLNPSPRLPVSIRVATMDDLPFIDGLQKKHTKRVGWMPRQQLEGYLKSQWVLIAEEMRNADCGVRNELDQSEIPNPRSAIRLGYVASRDRYLKRDELGAIFQLCVGDGSRRKFVGAMLIKAVFERAPYGCKLFCCWCAQDLEANHFWEAMGFVPLAFRTGARGRGKQQRVHIFWQRRIRAGDRETPYWFPSQTNRGSIGEDRIVLPIPPGVRWSDEMPILLPQQRPEISDQRSEVSKSKSKKAPQRPKYGMMRSKLHFAVPKPEKEMKERRFREKRQSVKNDPKLVSAARELRDRWLEQINAGEYLPEVCGKYDVARTLSRAEGSKAIGIQSTGDILSQPRQLAA